MFYEGVGGLRYSAKVLRLTYNFDFMKIVKNNFIPFEGFKCMQFLNIIFVRDGYELSDKDIRHEEIHWAQQKEMFIIFFWLWYIFEWLFRSVAYWSFRKAYKYMSFEMEAYFHDDLLYYLEHREKYYWTKYLRL